MPVGWPETQNWPRTSLGGANVPQPLDHLPPRRARRNRRRR